jgi:hypothetical protein
MLPSSKIRPPPVYYGRVMLSIGTAISYLPKNCFPRCRSSESRVRSEPIPRLSCHLHHPLSTLPVPILSWFLGNASANAAAPTSPKSGLRLALKDFKRSALPASACSITFAKTRASVSFNPALWRCRSNPASDPVDAASQSAASRQAGFPIDLRALISSVGIISGLSFPAAWAVLEKTVAEATRLQTPAEAVVIIVRRDVRRRSNCVSGIFRPLRQNC